MDEDAAGASTASDFYEMRNAYMNERFAPELLPHCNDLVARISKVIEDQEYDVQQLSGSEDALMRTIYQTEIERTKYLVGCYLRTRLRKIQDQALFLVQNEEARANLSENERNFAVRYAETYQNHIHREAWSHKAAEGIPETVKDLLRIELLATRPNLDEHVFCVPTRDVEGAIRVGGTTAVELIKDQVTMLPYAPLRHLVTSGDVLLT